ncbi:Uu.00g125500.m01.CDS01 [Anthostomella pinea]|uniref:Uu.00g125500.m01.CDS01 n=1 Tax=Anthostomella pinea TaxID=933095 RepID=A0AAI8VIG7_9PEZI|nr:Uu.00g125500.m01.CDS01 [Anthostomella pinea]
MAIPVADATTYGEDAAGFVSDNSQIQGFSSLHDSGTGGSPSLGNFPLFVHPGCPEDDYTKCNYTSEQRATPRINGTATARPGYFSIGLNNSVYAEMTSTMHASLFRFNFPSTAEVYSSGFMVPSSPLILIDLMDLGYSRSGGEVSVNPRSGRMKGSGTFRPSFGRGEYTAHFCADFRGAEIHNTGTFLNLNATDEQQALDSLGSGTSIPPGSAGTWIHFARPPKNQIMARVGLSFISEEQA